MKDDPLQAQNITISNVQLLMNSDGAWQLTGHAHEGGFAGGSYAYGLALDFADPTGKVIGFNQQDSLDGTSDPFGTQDKDWTKQGQNSLISDNWGIIKTKGFRAHLDATTDPLHVLEAIGVVLVAGIGGAATAAFIDWMIETPGEYHVQSYEDEHGGAGVDFKKTIQY